MKSFITAMVVMAVLSLLQKQTQKREQGMSEEVFLIKLSSKVFWLGLVYTSIGIALLIWWSLGTETVGLAIMLALGTMPGALLMVGPISGFWEILVNHNEITVTKCFIFKKHFNFSDITHCIGKRGGIKVYVKGRKRKAFFVDAMMNGAVLFEEKIMAAKIPVDGVAKEEVADELAQLSDGIMKKISKTLDARDAKALKNLFSESALKEAENIVQQISEFFEFYQGQIMVCDGAVGIENIREDGVKSCTSHYEVFTSKRKYALRYEYCHGGEKHPEKTGLYKLEVQHIKISKGDVKQEVLWKNSFQKAGIYIQNNT